MERFEFKKLDLISNIGIEVNENGDVCDNLGRPARRRGLPDPTPPRRRLRFTADDDQILQEWVLRAEEQGLQLGAKIFRDLESIVSSSCASVVIGSMLIHHWGRIRDIQLKHGRLGGIRSSAILLCEQRPSMKSKWVNLRIQKYHAQAMPVAQL